MNTENHHIKTYTELSKLKTFKERYDYLKLKGFVGDETFGHNRYLNQDFYLSKEWKRVRNQVIIRDNGCDLGDPDHPIPDKVVVNGKVRSNPILIHHINPITIEDIINGSDSLINPDNLICTSMATHNAIHFGDDRFLDPTLVERTPNDTCPWKKEN